MFELKPGGCLLQFQDRTMNASPHISRRHLLVLGASSLAFVVPALRNAKSGHDTRKAVLGVGGAGFNLVNQLRSQGAIQATLAHANSREVIRSADGILPIPLEVPLTEPRFPFGDVIRTNAEKLARRAMSALPETDRLILVAGLGGYVGSYITPELARLAKKAGMQVMGLVFLPFAWEGDEHYRERSVRSLQAIENALDVLHVIDMQKASLEVPANTSMAHFFSIQDNSGVAMIKEFLNTA